MGLQDQKIGQYGGLDGTNGQNSVCGALQGGRGAEHERIGRAGGNRTFLDQNR